MSRSRDFVVFAVLLAGLMERPVAGDPGQEFATKELDSAVQALSTSGWEKACQIWDWAEPGYQETRSSALLSTWLESNGFRVTRGISEIPTAFTAEIGSGSPVLAILGEYDALPGLSQECLPYREPHAGNSWGHGCGHHLFGVSSAMAAIALGEQIKAGKLPGTLRYYGCPAEEGGSAKAFLVRDGQFKDVDVALHWHPSSQNAAGDKSTLARIAVRFRFHGTSAHAAGSPEQGRSALDAVEITNYAANMLREHIPQQARMHYVITNGGQAPNVIPAEAEVYYYIRHPESQVVRELYARLLKCAEAGALATETRLEVHNEGGILELLPCTPLSDRIGQHLEQRLHLKIPDEDIEFAQRLQTTMAAPKPLDSIREISRQSGAVSMGSTDVGDVSWVVPTSGFSVACWVPGTPGHSWQAVACGKKDLARQAMIVAAEVLAATGRDVLTSPELVAEAKADFNQRLGKRAYAPLLTPEHKPALNYRKSATQSE